MMKRKQIIYFAFFSILFFSSLNLFVGKAYSLFDSLSTKDSSAVIGIGNDFWSQKYIFKDLNPQNFNKTGNWSVNQEGFTSTNGNIYIPNNKSQYVITSNAKLSGDATTHGAYQIYFESVLNANNLVNGYALIFDNINANIKIVEITNGNISDVLLTLSNSTHSFIPQNANNAAWRVMQEIKISVSEIVTTGYKSLNVWAFNNLIVEDYLIEEVDDPADNVSGYYSNPLKTTLIDLEIEHFISNIFTITFDSGGGSQVDSIREKSGEAISSPSNPNRAGYSFVNWKLNDNPYIFSTMPSSNIKLIANWSANEYVISFNSNGGSSVPSIVQNYNTSISEPLPSKQGYSFEGWFNKPTFTNRFVFSTMPLGNISLIAKWGINGYTINFNSNGGTGVNSITQDYNTNVSAPTSPTKNGYLFNGWLLNESPYVFNTMPSNNITLNATWIELAANEYTITFESNGGSSIPTLFEEEGNSISKPTNPSKLGYSFDGWYTTSSFTNLFVFDAMPSSDITLFAKWSINEYSINFNSNGGSSVSSIIQNYNTVVSEPAQPIRSGYLFVEWRLNSNPYTFTKMPSSNITLVAVWEEIQIYDIIFIVDGGTSVATISEENGTLVYEPTNPTKQGHTFDGWYTSSSFTTLFIFDVMPNINSTVYAKWNINSYTITYKTNGGNNIAPSTFNYGSTLVLASSPIKSSDFFFAGWFSDSKLKNRFTLNTMPSNNITIFADWGSSDLTFVSIAGGYRVTGYSSQSSYIQIPQYYNGQPVLEIGVSAFEGNDFIQYVNIPYKVTNIRDKAFKDASNIKELYIPNNVTTIGKNISSGASSLTVNAQAPSKPGGWNQDWNRSDGGWLANERTPVNWGVTDYSKITFISNGGSSVSAIVENEGVSVSSPTQPTREGYSFQGWYSDESLTNSYVFDVMEHITLFAKWSINEYSINFNSNGGTNVTSIIENYNTPIIGPTAPTRNGYLFDKWLLGGSSYVFTKMPSSNITLNATWIELLPNEYTITFNSNGGTSVSSLSAIEGTLISSPNQPTKEGHTFGGWYSTSTLTNLFVFNLMPSNNITLFAKWSINEYTITFISNGGSAISPLTFDYGETITMPNNPSKSGNIFAGWYLDSKLKNYYTFSTMPSNNITIYSDWGTTGLSYQLISGVGYKVTSVSSGIVNVQIPQRYQGLPVVEIGYRAFYNNKTIKTINIPYTTTKIGEGAFLDASSIIEIYIPINVVNAGSTIFKGANSITINIQASSIPTGWNDGWNGGEGFLNKWLYDRPFNLGSPDN